MVPTTIHTLKSRKCQWVNATHNGEEELQCLEKAYGLHPLDLKDCLPPLQRPKIVPRASHGYLFAILVFPAFNASSREIEQHEVDFFIMRDRVITVHDNSFMELKNFFELLELKADHRQTLMQNPPRFVSQLLDELFDSCFPMLSHISNDIDRLRAQVLHEHTRQAVYEILRLKNNIVTFRKALQPHRDLLKRLVNLLPRFHKARQDEMHYFDRLVDHTKEIWDHLETYASAIDAVQETHSTLLSLRLNETMKTLTVFSIIILSLHLISNLFIIDAFSRPIVGAPGDWWALLGIMTLGALAATWIFKKKKWL